MYVYMTQFGMQAKMFIGEQSNGLHIVALNVVAVARIEMD